MAIGSLRERASWDGTDIWVSSGIQPQLFLRPQSAKDGTGLRSIAEPVVTVSDSRSPPPWPPWAFRPVRPRGGIVDALIFVFSTYEVLR
jgi:hypothetical protein